MNGCVGPPPRRSPVPFDGTNGAPYTIAARGRPGGIGGANGEARQGGARVSKEFWLMTIVFLIFIAFASAMTYWGGYPDYALFWVISGVIGVAKSERRRFSNGV